MRARATFGTEFARAPAGQRPVVWSIAGSDTGAGAGLQADLKALQAFGVHGCTAVAAITAQNSVALTRVEPVGPELLDAQLAALAADMPPADYKGEDYQLDQARDREDVVAYLATLKRLPSPESAAQ